MPAIGAPNKDLSPVFQLIRLGQVDIKNRIVFPSMCLGYSDANGLVTPRIREFLVARAKGGVGALIVPGSVQDPPSRARPSISDDRHIAAWRELRELVAANGTRLFCQLHPPSARSEGAGLRLPAEYTIAEVRELAEAYANAARRAREAGLDGVEIHGAHEHEIALFLSARYNRRQDAYGLGIEGRAKLALEIIAAIKARAGGNFPVVFRFSGGERIPLGSGLDDSRQFALLLQCAGADAIHVSIGVPHSRQWTRAPSAVPPGFLIGLAAEIKKVVGIPVIAVGRINSLALAARAIRRGQADMVAMGRALLADPDLPRKSAVGDEKAVLRCIACNEACGGSRPGGVSCLQNPWVGKEYSFVHVRMSRPSVKRVLIAGAGPAGLEAACTLAQRGHRVRVFERNDESGGVFRLACLPPTKKGFAEVIRVRERLLRTLGVPIAFRMTVDAELVKEESPDVVVVATGSLPANPLFPIAGEEIHTAVEVLAGRPLSGNQLLVIGGGMIGCETADYLATRGCRIDLVEASTCAAGSLNDARRQFLLERLRRNGVTLLLGAEVKAVALPFVTLGRSQATEQYGPYDSVVLAVGRRPNAELASAIRSSFPSVAVFIIGDAQNPRTAVESISEGALLAEYI